MRNTFRQGEQIAAGSIEDWPPRLARQYLESGDAVELHDKPNPKNRQRVVRLARQIETAAIQTHEREER